MTTICRRTLERMGDDDDDARELHAHAAAVRQLLKKDAADIVAEDIVAEDIDAEADGGCGAAHGDDAAAARCPVFSAERCVLQRSAHQSASIASLLFASRQPTLVYALISAGALHTPGRE